MFLGELRSMFLGVKELGSKGVKTYVLLPTAQ